MRQSDVATGPAMAVNNRTPSAASCSIESRADTHRSDDSSMSNEFTFGTTKPVFLPPAALLPKPADADGPPSFRANGRDQTPHVEAEDPPDYTFGTTQALQLPDFGNRPASRPKPLTPQGRDREGGGVKIRRVRTPPSHSIPGYVPSPPRCDSEPDLSCHGTSSADVDTEVPLTFLPDLREASLAAVPGTMPQPFVSHMHATWALQAQAQAMQAHAATTQAAHAAMWASDMVAREAAHRALIAHQITASMSQQSDELHAAQTLAHQSLSCDDVEAAEALQWNGPPGPDRLSLGEESKSLHAPTSECNCQCTNKIAAFLLMMLLIFAAVPLLFFTAGVRPW